MYPDYKIQESRYETLYNFLLVNVAPSGTRGELFLPGIFISGEYEI